MHTNKNIGKILGYLSILSAVIALYSAFIRQIGYDNLPLSIIGTIAIVLGILAIKKGAKKLGIIGIIGGIPSTAIFLFQFIFFASGGTR